MTEPNQGDSVESESADDDPVTDPSRLGLDHEAILGGAGSRRDDNDRCEER